MFLAFKFIVVFLLSVHHVYKLSKMVSLRSLSTANRKQREEATLETLRMCESTRNIPRDFQVSQSWVVQFCKQHLSELSDVNYNFGGKSQVYNATDC